MIVVEALDGDVGRCRPDEEADDFAKILLGLIAFEAVKLEKVMLDLLQKKQSMHRSILRFFFKCVNGESY